MENEGSIKCEETASQQHLRSQKRQVRIAYGLLWISASIAMFIAIAFMLLLTDVDPKNLYFYIPLAAFVAIMAFAIPLAAKITRHYSK